MSHKGIKNVEIFSSIFVHYQNPTLYESSQVYSCNFLFLFYFLSIDSINYHINHTMYLINLVINYKVSYLSQHTNLNFFLRINVE